ncbi:MAG: diaminopimelate dehydrogenase [Lachnospiraceae bacterium]|nr:diaminopimelate dehydrogenase [Lachnospiraceae bacterium]
MMKIGILGYGNLGKGVEKAVQSSPDMELTAVFTRRDPAGVQIAAPGAKVLRADELGHMQGDIDVLILCGGSATDLPEMTPKYAAGYNVVDSFDTHARIPEHFAAVDAAAKGAGKVAVISCGWDPGLFSLSRLYAHSVLPGGSDYTFWGRGVSQGHSDAIRRIDGVLDARQYTVPVPDAVERVRRGENPTLTTREKHTRECYVVAAEDADKARIEKEIKEMPNYFADYDTTVTFITAQEMKEKHQGLPHGGSVIYSGSTGDKKHVIEYSLKLDSNPEFTGSVLTACARAAYRMNSEGMSGAKTMFDIAPAWLSPLSGEEIRAHML